MRIFDVARGLLSFRDLCGSRSVCKSWNDLKALPAHPYKVFFFEDGSEWGTPDSDDPNFRKSLLAAKISNFHCQIFTNEQLVFVLKLMPSIKVLTFEIDGAEMTFESTCALSTATSVEKLELDVSNMGANIVVDFQILKKMIHFESNTRVQFKNFDKRDMVRFSYLTDFWDDQCSEIASCSQIGSAMRLEQHSNTFLQYLGAWVKNKDMLPKVCEATINSMTFCDISREGLSLRPVDEYHGAQHASFQDYYSVTFVPLFNMWPDIPLNFPPSFTDDMKQFWLNILNPVRQSYGLDPYTV